MLVFTWDLLGLARRTGKVLVNTEPPKVFTSATDARCRLPPQEATYLDPYRTRQHKAPAITF